MIIIHYTWKMKMLSLKYMIKIWQNFKLKNVDDLLSPGYSVNLLYFAWIVSWTLIGFVNNFACTSYLKLSIMKFLYSHNTHTHTHNHILLCFTYPHCSIASGYERIASYIESCWWERQGFSTRHAGFVWIPWEHKCGQDWQVLWAQLNCKHERVFLV